LIHLSRADAEVICFSPDVSQDVVDHVSSKNTGDKRNALIESARLARGELKPLNQLNPKNFDAVIFPGGYGAAKTLSSFASEGANFSLNSDVEKALRGFHGAKKTIGSCCIAPVMLPKAIPNVKVTIGNDKYVAEAINKLGGRHEDKNVNEICIDEENNIVTTPAYMSKDASIFQVYEGIGKLVDEVYKKKSNEKCKFPAYQIR